MANLVTCPRCGAENPASAMNCVNCRINLGFAHEHPEEVERIKQEDRHRERFALANYLASPVSSEAGPVLLPTLLLLGSFIFAFCLGEAIHELGHYLTHRMYGVNVGVRLDPFGGSMIVNGSSAPCEIWGVTSLAGPLLNLLVGTTLSLSLWQKRRQVLLPLLLWGPISLIQEGVTFSLGMLTPGGDADLIVRWGVPAAVIIGVGVLFFVSGIIMICWLLPLVNLAPEDSFRRKFSILMGGMVSFMILRLIFSGFHAQSQLMENTVPLIFSILLGIIVVLLYRPVYSVLSRISTTELAAISRPAIILSMALGVGIVVFQLVSFN